VFVVFAFQQQNQLRERVFTLSHKLSAMSFGQDRYRRRYWVLPKCGGIFVEGLESGEPESADPSAPEVDRKVEVSADKDACFKPITPPAAEESAVKAEPVEKSCISTDADHSSENKLQTEDLIVEPSLGNDIRSREPSVCDKIGIEGNDSFVVKQENSEKSSSNCGPLKAELVSLNCLIGNDAKMNGDVSVVDCKNGYVDLKNCIRPDGDCLKVEPRSVPSPCAAGSDTKHGILADDGCVDVQSQMPAAHLQLISDSATSDLMCYKLDDGRLPRTPSKDDISLLRHSGILQLAASSSALSQFGVTSSQSYSVASSQRTSPVPTPLSEVGAGPQPDVSAAGTPVSFMQPSRTSTPGHMSTSFTEDFQLSADGELQPDYLAVPQNVEPISLGNSVS